LLLLALSWAVSLSVNVDEWKRMNIHLAPALLQNAGRRGFVTVIHRRCPPTEDETAASILPKGWTEIGLK
jgi:hypothetical protein